MMGPIEQELRALPATIHGVCCMSRAAWIVLLDASASLGIGHPARSWGRLPEVFSEAIEAAGALGL